MANIFGTAGNDLLIDPDTQDGGANTLRARQGDDSLYGGANNDILYAGDGSDYLFGESGDDQLWGDFENLIPAPGNDYLDGGDGNDQLVGESGSDTLIGGLGADLLYGQGSGTDDGASDYLSGGDGDDDLFAGGGGDTLIGGIGLDELRGEAGTDVLFGEADDDVLYGGDDADTLSGGAGADDMRGDLFGSTPGNDSMDGGDGDDFLEGGGANDTLTGGIGADELWGGANDDWLFGGVGNDELRGDTSGTSPGNDSLSGADGSDTLSGENGNDSLDGGADADWLFGGSGDDSLEGGTGGDGLQGSDGNDTYFIDDLNDDIFDSSGASDTAIISVSDFKVPSSIENVQYVNGAEPLEYYIDALYSGSRWGLFGAPTTISYAFLDAPTASATYNGATGFEAMDAGEQAIVLQSLAEFEALTNITFVAYGGNPADADISFGQNEQLSSTGYALFPANGDVYIDITTGVFAGVVNHETGHALGLKHPFEDAPVLTGEEDSNYYSIMSYTGRSNTLFRDVTELPEGGYDIDYFTVRGDEPMLYDIAALQHMYGANTATGAGDDVYTFAPDTPFFRALWDGGGTDTLDISGVANGSLLDLRDGHFSSIRILSDPLPPGYSGAAPTYDGTDNLAIAYGAVIENATGGSGDDTLIGNDSANVLDGNAGNDTLDGGVGIDSLSGGGGDDLHVVSVTAADGGSRIVFVSDSVAEFAPDGMDTVSSSSSFTLPDNVENLVLTGAPLWRAYIGTGNELANVIEGEGTARHRLNGQGGNDTLSGGTGADTFSSGSGADVFLFDTAPSADTVLDFTSGTDHINLENAIFTAFGATGVVGVASVQVGQQADIGDNSGDGDDYLKYATDTGHLYYDSDGSAGGGLDLIATVYSDGATPVTFGFSPTSDIVIV